MPTKSASLVGVVFVGGRAVADLPKRGDRTAMDDALGAGARRRPGSSPRRHRHWRAASHPGPAPRAVVGGDMNDIAAARRRRGPARRDRSDRRSTTSGVEPVQVAPVAGRPRQQAQRSGRARASARATAEPDEAGGAGDQGGHGPFHSRCEVRSSMTRRRAVTARPPTLAPSRRTGQKRRDEAPLLYSGTSGRAHRRRPGRRISASATWSPRSAGSAGPSSP